MWRGRLRRKALGQGGNPAEMLRLDEPETFKDRRYVTNDSTYEALGEILADNPHGMVANKKRPKTLSLIVFLPSRRSGT
jgi:hypothetical protein